MENNIKLKTLKDLEKVYRGDRLDWADVSTLKQEAIKWVKFNMQEREKYTFEDRADYTGLIDGFMEFFNLTEEDLNDKTNE